MSGEIHTDAEELLKLGTSFEMHAYDLGRHLSSFKRRTDSVGSKEYAELAEEMGGVIAVLQERLDEIGHGMKETARNATVADEAAAEAIRGVR